MAKKSFTSHLKAASEAQRETETFVKGNIQIDGEFRGLIPPLGEEEFVQLEANVLAEGIREPLIVWKEENLLIDGHNRYELSQRHGLDFRVQLKTFDSREAAKSWMINNQLGRRNLSSEQQSYLRGKRYESEKQQHGGSRKSSSQNANLKTSDALADTYKVSKDTIIRDAKFAKGIDLIGERNPILKEQILKGLTKVKKTEVQQLPEALEKHPERQWELQSPADLRKLLASLKEKVAKKAANKPTPPASLEASLGSFKDSVERFVEKPEKDGLKQLKKMIRQLESLLNR